MIVHVVSIYSLHNTNNNNHHFFQILQKRTESNNPDQDRIWYADFALQEYQSIQEIMRMVVEVFWDYDDDGKNPTDVCNKHDEDTETTAKSEHLHITTSTSTNTNANVSVFNDLTDYTWKMLAFAFITLFVMGVGMIALCILCNRSNRCSQKNDKSRVEAFDSTKSPQRSRGYHG